MALPERVAQDHRGRAARHVFLGQERAPLREIYAQHRK